ncbi:RING finger protein 37 [Xenentodon cancila]
MVVNFCQPHFETTVHCNKLCADGYDVTNLVSSDPALRRRGFKLEYFLRPPLQVTLKFGFQVELCRVDVELWPWGMDRGQACKRLEISTSSDQVEQKDHKKMQPKDQNDKNQHKHQKSGSKSQQTNGHRWMQLSQQWDEPQPRGRAFKCQSNAQSVNCEPEFKLVGRCELREETHVCFTSSNFLPRTPFLSPPPPPPADCRQVQLWSRGLPSLGAVTQLRVTVPYGGAASSLGLKALTVWGQPSRCCPAEQVERIGRIHEDSKRQLPRPAFFALSDRQTTQPPQAPASVSIPEDFLDPLTQEVMTLPMLLPSGVSVDTTTLDEYQKREASWGRQPNDPFTGVPFTSISYPLPNPQLKSRIDRFLLQKGITRRDGVLGRQERGQSPQASRLVTSIVHGQSQEFPGLIRSSVNCVRHSSDDSVQQEDSSSNSQNYTSKAPSLSTDNKLERGKQRPGEIPTESDKRLATKKELEPQTKRPKIDSISGPSCISHEQRLSASLDEALLSALRGRPSFTANLTHKREAASDPDPPKTTQQQSSGLPRTSTGEKACSGCSSSVSVYSTSSSSIYRLLCGHLLCRTCLQKRSKPPNSAVASTAGRVLCPTCRSPTTRSDITRVHH